MRVGVTEPRNRPPRREPAQPAISGTTRTQRDNKKAASQKVARLAAPWLFPDSNPVSVVCRQVQDSKSIAICKDYLRPSVHYTRRTTECQGQYFQVVSRPNLKV